MLSMTGFGVGEDQADGLTITVQISSVNRKQSDIRVTFPREIADLEKTFRDRISKKLTRGSVNVKTTLLSGSSKSGVLTLDKELARQLWQELSNLNDELETANPVTLQDLLTIRDVNLFTYQEIPSHDLLKKLAVSALDQALNELMAAKKKEGVNLQSDIHNRLQNLLVFLKNVSKRAPEVPQNYRNKLLSRIREVLETTIEDERILKEIALFAERCDISEELTRLGSHLEQMENLLKKTIPVGRKLDFLIQEIFREINTIGSKSNDLEISKSVIDFKTELERIREQVQNIE